MGPSCSSAIAGFYEVTSKTTLKRYAKRAEYDRAVVHAILDEVLFWHASSSTCPLGMDMAQFSLPRVDTILLHAQAFVCHIGFVADGQPYVIPTGYARDGEVLYLHGSVGSRMLRALESGGGETSHHHTCDAALLAPRLAFRVFAFPCLCRYIRHQLLRLERHAEGERLACRYLCHGDIAGRPRARALPIQHRHGKHSPATSVWKPCWASTSVYHPSETTKRSLSAIPAMHDTSWQSWIKPGIPEMLPKPAA